MTDDSKRRHVSNACQPCRVSKIKCDGARPVCGNCAKKEKDCHFVVKDDKRRVSLRSAVDVLSSRVSALSQALIQHGLPLPIMDPNQEKMLKDICETLDIPLPPLSDQVPDLGLGQSTATRPSSEMSHWQETNQIGNQSAEEPAFQTTEIPVINHEAPEGIDCLSASDGYPTDGSTADWPWHMIEGDPFSLSDPLDLGPLDNHAFLMPRNTVPISASKAIFNPIPGVASGVSSDDEPESDLVHEVSARFGALRVASDGQLRYYGAVTNYHLLEGSRHDEDVEMFSTKQETLDRLQQAGLDQDIPTDLEEQLIDLYFTWHNPSHVNVDRDTFFAARSNENETAMSAGYASPVLLNAM